MWSSLVHGFWFRKACFCLFIRTEFHLFSICTGQHLEPQEIQLLCVWRWNEITFSCTSEKYQEHLSDQTGPFVLLQQVFLIKNAISLTNCFIAFAAGLIVFMVLYLCDSLREQRTRRNRAWFLLYLPCVCHRWFPNFGPEGHTCTSLPSGFPHEAASSQHGTLYAPCTPLSCSLTASSQLSQSSCVCTGLEGENKEKTEKYLLKSGVQTGQICFFL